MKNTDFMVFFGKIMKNGRERKIGESSVLNMWS